MPAVELEVFLRYLLPWGPESAQLYKSVTTMWTTKAGERATINEAVKSYDELIELIASRTAWKGADVYLALGTQKIADTKGSRDGRAVYAIRRANNMATFNALWVDVDVGKKEGYQTTAEAEAAAEAFHAASGMPPVSMRVHSGSGGFHDYWCVNEPMDKETWLSFATALKRAAEKHGFKADLACTADAARILRIPTTLNHKHTPPRTCRLDIPVTKAGGPCSPDDLTSALAPFMVAAKKTGTGASATISTIGSNFTENAETKLPPVTIDAVAVNCPMTAQTLANGGAGKPEPQWQMDIYLAAFTADPVGAAHRLSEGHEDYDADKTNEKLQQKQVAIAAHNLGWPECSKFHHAACKTCPLLAHGKSPLHFAQPDVPSVQPTEDNDEIMPDGYFRNKDSKHVIGELANGRYFKVIPYSLLDAFIDSETNEPVIKYAIGKKEHFGAISLSKQGPTGVAEAWTKATNNTMLLNPKTLGPFMMSFVQKLQSLGDARHITASGMGWQGENFVFDEVYMPDGSKAAYRSRDIIDLNYKREGKIEPWHNAMEMIYGNTVMEILVASSFAAPLVSLIAPHSVILSIYSPASAFGKTTAMSIAQSVWAQPERMSQIQDTTNSVMGKLAALRNLPLYWDELKLQEDMEDIVKIIFRVISGRDKTRMKQDASLRRQAEVARTLMAVCSNQSVVSMAVEATSGTDAGGLRVFEIQADPLVKKAGLDGEQLLLPLDRNYGVAGSRYIQSLVRNKAKVEAILKRTRDEYQELVGFEDRERFWRTTMVAIGAGAAIANATGLTKFDVPAIKERLIHTLEQMRHEQVGAQTNATTTAHGAVGIFNEMCNELLGERRLVLSDSIDTSRGRRHPSAVAKNMGHLGGDATLYRDVVAQESKEDGRRLIKKSAFAKWMHDHRRQPSQILKLLRTDYHIEERRLTLCAGVFGFSMSPVDCWDFRPINHNPSSPSASSD